MTETTADEILFSEPGATWLWALVGPGAAVAMALIQMSTGYGLQPVVPGVFLVLVTGFLSIQIKAARIHTSVELTPEYLRQGTETIRLSEIVKIFPEASGSETPKWQSARALGELDRRPTGTYRYRGQADQRQDRSGVGAQAQTTACGADRSGGRARIVSQPGDRDRPAGAGDRGSSRMRAELGRGAVFGGGRAHHPR